MSASVQKDSFTLIGIHKAPVNLSKQEFDAKVGEFYDSLAALPAVKKNFLSFDVIFQNSIMDAKHEAHGIPAPQPCVILMATFETVDNFKEYFQDRAAQEFFQNADKDIASPSASIAFSADVVTRIGVPRSEFGSTATERKLWVGIYKGPESAVPSHITQFQKNANATFDDYVALPVCRKNILSHSVWTPNASVDGTFQAADNAMAKPAMIEIFEVENWDRAIEAAEDVENIDISKKATQSFGLYVGSNCFGADVVKKI
ncbi:hypothetical protein MSAN_00219800 [Mycena sanguinolenta]|uniref:Uncharacterized protein n=1 Tax=Mycena sanguinolenta TaxID=230812 RepID=A0A8H6ZIH2_9AGAR|nr:hypothetical protein MSAN_00219800 [Mycena sanguinolenta]